nr:hypothetical protein [Micromonospora matsumotoense]
MHPAEEVEHRTGGEFGLLGLRVVAGVGHHDDLAAQGLADPGRLGRRVREVGVALAHDDEHGGVHLGETRLGETVVGLPCGTGERRAVAGLPELGDDGRPVCGEVGRLDAGVEGGQVGLPDAGHPERRHHQVEEAPHAGRLPGVAHERSDEHEAGDLRGVLGCDDDTGPGGPGVADDDRRPAELGDQGADVGGRLGVAVGREGGVAVAVTAQVGAGHGETGGDQGRGEEPVRRAQLRHPGHEHHERAAALDVVGDAAFRAVQVAGR